MSNIFAQTTSPEKLARVSRSVVRVIVSVSTSPVPQSVPVEIRNLFQNNSSFIVGSGMFVNDSGDVVTVAHVFRAAQSVIDVLSKNGVHASLLVGITDLNIDSKRFISTGYSSLESRLAAIDNSRDLALLKPFVNPFTAFVNSSRKPVPGIVVIPSTPKPTAVKIINMRPRDAESIFACGFALGSENLLTTQGTIASAWKTEVPSNAAELGGKEIIDIYWADLRIDHGDSGGPVFLARNQSMVGIVIEISTGAAAFAHILPAKYVTDFLDKSSAKWELAK